MVHEFVIKTALSSFYAKLSCIISGYLPSSILTSNKEDSYERLMCLVAAILEDDKHKSKKKFSSQSPLVNLGYATRISLISTILYSFILYSEEEIQSKKNSINVIVLGCGVDMLGICALSIMAPQGSINVYDLDCKEICDLKHEIISQLKISEKISSSLQNKINSDYHIIESDLEHLTKTDIINLGIDFKSPTIIVSELVLAYIPRKTLQNLLNLFSSEFHHPHSWFMAYEPVGEKICRNINEHKSEKDQRYSQFSHHYFKKFDEKFYNEKNTFPHDDFSGKREAYFSPLGCSNEDVEDLFHSCNFDHINSYSVKYLASAVCNLTPMEPFDEFASLSLYLDCYSIILAAKQNIDFSSDFIQIFESSEKLDSSSTIDRLRNTTHFNSVDYEIDVISKRDEKQVRELYLKTYMNLSKEYPIIKKMLSTALEKDLSSDSIEKRLESEEEKCLSNVLLRYQNLGGAFWVARRKIPSEEENEKESELVGFLGIRKYKSSETKSINKITLEIQRFIVHEKYQRQGIGKAFLSKCYEFLSETYSQEQMTLSLIATTPTILEKANKFYTSNGFLPTSEKFMGSLTLRTYESTFHSSWL